jgi:hypothetical protein
MRGSLARIQLIEAPAIVKSGSSGAPRLTARLGYLQQSRAAGSARRTLLVWNANSHADRHGDGCPSAPAKQHSRGAHLTAALQR